MAISDLEYTDDSDIALIRRTRTGDVDAYGLLHARHAGAAKALAWRMSRSASDADDLVSEGFARVLGALQRGRGPEVAFRPYLLSTIRRLAYDRTNREKRETPVEYDLDEPMDPQGDPVVEGFERDTAAAAFATLPERWRMVLWHTEVEGQSPAQVAELLGIKPNAVAALAYRAREGLRQAYLSQHAAAAPSAANECRLTNDRLASYVRGGLTAPQEARVRDHLEACEDCRAAYLELASVNTSLRGLVGFAVLGPAAAPYLAELLRPSAIPAASAAATPAVATARGASGGTTAGGWAGRLAASAGPAKVALTAASVLLAVVVGVALAGADGDGRDVALRVPAAARTADPDTPADGARVEGDVTSVPSTVPPPAGPTATTAPRTSATVPASWRPRGPAPARAVGPARPAAPVAPDPAPDPAPPPTRVPPTTTAPVTPPTTVPVTPPTTVPVTRSALTLGLASAGPLVADRPGVLVAQVGNDGDGPGRTVRLQIDLTRMALRGLPQVGSGSAPRAAGAGWTCLAEGPTRLVCTTSQLALGQPASLYVPVSVAPGTAPAGASGRITGADDVASSAAAPEVELDVRPHGMAARFATVDRGDVAVIGGGLLTCPDTDRDCAAARSGQGSRLDNGDFAMAEVDVDGDPTTTNSSAAALALPVGAEVLSAQAYWSADLVGTSPGHDAPDPGALGRAVLRSPSGARGELVAERVDRVGASRYQAVADVTDLVRSGGAGAWTLGGVQLGTGPGAYGGWSIVVVYRDASAPMRSLVVLDGLTQVDTGASQHLEVGGFTVPAGGARAATLDVVAFEGDAGLRGDQLLVAGQAIADAVNPMGNTFNSTVSSGGRSSGVNQFGVDLDRFDVTGELAPGSTAVAIDLTTEQDVYLTGVVAFTVDQ